MKKNSVIYVFVWICALALFNVLTFVPKMLLIGKSALNNSFWVAYAVISIAFAVQLACSLWVLQGDSRKVFYRVSIARVSYASLVISLIVGIGFMSIEKWPLWLLIVVCGVVLFFEILMIIKAVVASETVGAIDDKIKTDTVFITNAIDCTRLLVAGASNATISFECKKVYESFRYSDPRSCEETKEVDEKLGLLLSALSEAVQLGDESVVANVCKNITVLVMQRNMICKSTK